MRGFLLTKSQHHATPFRGDLDMNKLALLTTVILLVRCTPIQAEPPQGQMRLHVVPTTLKSYRLLAMSKDEAGFIWAGSIHQAIHRYDPRTGKVETIPLPCKATASACICVGDKVYILGQSHPA
jgi:streptogramin lyase